MRAFVLLALSLAASPALAHPNEIDKYGRSNHAQPLPGPVPVSQQVYPQHAYPQHQPVQYVGGYAKYRQPNPYLPVSTPQPTPSVGATACVPISIGNPRYNYAP